MDPRYIDLAKVLAGHSVRVNAGEKILIDNFGIPDLAVIAIIREIRKMGAIVFLNNHHERLTRELLLHGTDEQWEAESATRMKQMEGMDGYIALRGSGNIFESSDVPADRVALCNEHMKKVLNERVNKTKWVVLRWPTSAMAQQAQMSTEEFEDFYFRVCTMDYSRMTPGMAALKERMDNADQVEIKGEGTHLKFSIKGLPGVSCGGDRNIPDGEVFSCPVKDSVNGVIQYNAPTVYRGISFDNIRLVFENGKVVEATGSDTEKLNEILDSDAGSRYIGEFAIGFNPYITHAMRDILFDEKIAGSFHFTPGQAYEDCYNGNDSQVHWDMVCIQTPEFGGGEIYFDGELIRKDGMFIPEDLHKLNPEYLKGED